MVYHISVFAGSHAKPGEPVYQDALHLGRLIAESGYILLNGGYIGAMEGLSRGASEAGGHVIGVTCDEIEAWRPVKPNRWISEEWRYNTLGERMFALIKNADALLALPGGVGTLAEITLTWNLLLTRVISSRPFILIGPGWQAVIQQLITQQGDFIPESQRGWFSLATDVETAFQRLQETLSDGKV